MDRVPKDCNLHSGIYAEVETLLNKVEPQHRNMQIMVDSIVDQALAPLKRRDDEARAVEQAIKSELRWSARRSEWETRARSEATKAVAQLENATYADMYNVARAAVATANAA